MFTFWVYLSSKELFYILKNGGICTNNNLSAPPCCQLISIPLNGTHKYWQPTSLNVSISADNEPECQRSINIFNENLASKREDRDESASGNPDPSPTLLQAASSDSLQMKVNDCFHADNQGRE
jgi:hypothetical protein